MQMAKAGSRGHFLASPSLWGSLKKKTSLINCFTFFSLLCIWRREWRGREPREGPGCLPKEQISCYNEHNLSNMLVICYCSQLLSKLYFLIYHNSVTSQKFDFVKKGKKVCWQNDGKYSTLHLDVYISSFANSKEKKNHWEKNTEFTMQEHLQASVSFNAS